MPDLINVHKSAYLPEVFTDGELEALFSYLRNSLGEERKTNYTAWAKFRNYVLCKLYATLGLRPACGLKLKVEDIDFARLRLTVRAENNKEHLGRVITLTDELADLLKEYLSEPLTALYMRDNYLFPTSHQAYMNKHTWKLKFSTILRQAGIYRKPTRTTHGHLSTYTFRHTFATNLYRKTRDILLVANFLGHTTLSSTLVYIHLSKILDGYYDYMRSAQESISRKCLFKPSECIRDHTPT